MKYKITTSDVDNIIQGFESIPLKQQEVEREIEEEKKKIRKIEEEKKIKQLKEQNTKKNKEYIKFKTTFMTKEEEKNKTKIILQEGNVFKIYNLIATREIK